MRIVGPDSPSLPPLDPLPPLKNLWARQVELEEGACFHVKEKLSHRDHTAHFSDCEKDRSGRSLNWAESRSSNYFHGSRHAEIKLCKLSDKASSMKRCDGSWRHAMSSKQQTRRQAYSPAQRKYNCDHDKIRSSDLLEAGRKDESKISPSRNHRSHQYGQSRDFMGNNVAEMASRSCYLLSQSSDNLHSKQSQRERHGGILDVQAAEFSTNADLVEHERIQDVQLSDDKGELKCGYHRSGTGDVKHADHARFAKLSQAECDKKKWRNSRSSSNEVFRRSRGGIQSEAKDESIQDKGEFNFRARSRVKNWKHGKEGGCIQAAGDEAESRTDRYADNGVKSSQLSAVIDEKCRSFDTTNRAHQEHFLPKKFVTKLASQLSTEVGAPMMQQCSSKRTGDERFDTILPCGVAGRGNTLTEVQGDNMQEFGSLSDNMLEVSSRDNSAKLAPRQSEEVGASLFQHPSKRMGDEGIDTNLSLAAAGRSNTSTEVQQNNMQETSSLSDNMLEVSSRDGAEAKGDPSDTEQQYKMLASLLLDDSLDIGQEFDVPLTLEGPDLGFCGSIFDDDFQIPVSMDAADVAHIKNTESMKKEPMPDSEAADFRGSHLCVMRSLFQDGKNVMKHSYTSTNKHGNVSDVVRDTNKPAEKHQPPQRSLKMKSSPRVFVDVTNKFEIHAPPVTKVVQENDSHRLNQRQKQVEFGKNTLGYERYCELVPRCKRKPQDPQTPNPKQICSKRSWDGQIRKWRRLLHVYDLPNVDGEERAEDFSILKLRQGLAAANNTRVSEWIDIKGCIASKVKVKEDASLSIYEDWIVS